jgi:hypothetical protein
MSARRNFFIRAVGTVAGDFAVGFALATACIWVIEGAALGLFLSFLLWLLALIVALALSQYVVHPVAAVALSDRKLDQGIDALASLARSAGDLAQDLGAPPWEQLRQSVSRFAAGFARR